MTQFVFLRHGEPLWSLTDERKLKGSRRDLVPLTEEGAKVVEEVARDERLVDAELIISSPYTRALHTAAIVSRVLDLPLVVEYDLHEWLPDLAMEYSTYEELLELVEDFDAHQGIYPEGEVKIWESMESIRNRVSQVLQKYLNYSKVIVVCHGMVIRSQVGVDLLHAEIIEHMVE